MTGCDYWTDKTVMVTGGAGFLGSHLVEKLEARASDVEIFIPRSDQYDLREEADIRQAFSTSKADVVIHLAASVGSIGANQENPAGIFMTTPSQVSNSSSKPASSTSRSVRFLGLSVRIPKHTPVPFQEENLFNGYPEETNAPYGIVKKALLTQFRAYRKQWGFNSIYLLPVNLYDPQDDFDLETSHVIPAIIRKCIEARERDDESITVWGTGEPTRKFLYMEDAAEGILDATESYSSSDPVNLGSGNEISIRELVGTIADEIGFEGEIERDTFKPDGQPRRRLDTTRAKERFGWEASTDFVTGLRKTIEWYETNRDRLYD